MNSNLSPAEIETFVRLYGFIQPMMMVMLGVLTSLQCFQITYLAVRGEPVIGRIATLLCVIAVGIVIQAQLGGLVDSIKNSDTAPRGAGVALPQVGLFDIAALLCFTTAAGLFWWQHHQGSAKRVASGAQQAQP